MTALTVVLIRHAQAEQGTPPGLNDHGRMLTPRGLVDAAAGGRWLVAHDLRPDLVLCSTAVRTQQTWQAIVAGAVEAPGSGLAGVEVWREDRIYLAPWPELLAGLAQVPDEMSVVAIVGHAPGIPDLAAELAHPGRSHSEALHQLQMGYPTMTMAVLTGDTAVRDAPQAAMTLTAVATPRA